MSTWTARGTDVPVYVFFLIGHEQNFDPLPFAIFIVFRACTSQYDGMAILRLVVAISTALEALTIF